MANLDGARLRRELAQVVGPSPWYWETFCAPTSATGKKFIWSHHGTKGSLAYLVSLSLEHEIDKPCLLLNTYCRPFLVPPAKLGIWCPESANLRLMCFDLDQLQSFDFAEIVGWFKQSADRVYATTPPIADFEVPSSLKPGMNKIDVPAAFEGVEELIVPTQMAATAPAAAVMALFVFYLHAGLVEILPQNWLRLENTDVRYQWITRAARDSQSHRIFGDGFRVRPFLLQENGTELEAWIE
jgi:hypothetical protein